MSIILAPGTGLPVALRTASWSLATASKPTGASPVDTIVEPHSSRTLAVSEECSGDSTMQYSERRARRI